MRFLFLAIAFVLTITPSGMAVDNHHDPSTPAAPEFVGSLSATAISLTSATLNAVVLPRSVETKVVFRIGPEVYYTTTVPASPSPIDGILPVTVSGTATGLTPGRIYHFSANATNALGTKSAADFTFSTLRLPTAVADSIIVNSRALLFDPRLNDLDPDRTGLEIVAFTQGARGKVEAVPAGALIVAQGGLPPPVPPVVSAFKLIYTPDLASPGNDQFTYTLRGGSKATVTVTSISKAVPDILLNTGQPVTFNPLENDKPSPGRQLSISHVSQGLHGKVEMVSGRISYKPASGIAVNDQFTYTLNDQSVGLVTVIKAPIHYRAGFGSAQTVTGASPGTLFETFGPPAPGPFSGKLTRDAAAPLGAIFAADGSVRLQVGDPAPGIAQARIARLGVPNGHAALITLQTQRGVVGRENDTVLYTGLADGNLRIAARGGSSVPGLPNAFFRSIVAFDGNGSTVFFLATLAGKNIHSSNNVALFAALENGSVRLLARKGARLDNSTTTVLSTLVGTQGTLAEGRWRLDDHTIGVRLSFADKTYGLYSIPDDAVQVSDWKCWMKPNFIEDEGELRIPVTPSPIGMPAFSAAGVSYLATIPPTPNLPVRAGGITKANDLLLIHLPVTGKSRILAREGDPVTGLDGKPVDGIVFKSFLDPVEGSTKHVSLPLENNEVCCPACQSPDLLAMRGTNVPVEVVKRHVAFLATLKGTNVGNTNHIGLFTATSMGAARLVARTGSPTPEGGLWNQFVSLVLPNRTDIDALFTATLSDSGDQKVTPENNLGLWVCTNGGAPSLLLRSGQPFFIKNFPKQIRGFVALAPAPGSIGAASGHDDDGHVSVLATFTDGTETLIHIELP